MGPGVVHKRTTPLTQTVRATITNRCNQCATRPLAIGQHQKHPPVPPSIRPKGLASCTNAWCRSPFPTLTCQLATSMVHDHDSDRRAPPAPPRPSSTRLQGPGVVHKRTMSIARDSELTTTMTAHCKGDDDGMVQTPDGAMTTTVRTPRGMVRGSGTAWRRRWAWHNDNDSAQRQRRQRTTMACTPQ